MRVLFLTPECTPFASSGGLGDVSASLPLALGARGLDVRIVMPLYRSVDRSVLEKFAEPLRVPIGERYIESAVWRGILRDSVPVYLIDQAHFFDRPGLYGPNGSAYADNLERFSFFTRASLALTGQLHWSPDVIHANDWQTALAPVYVGKQAEWPELDDCASLFTIHNVGYQGIFPLGGFDATGLAFEHLYPAGLEHFGHLNLLKAGLSNATVLSTVSPTYGKEIQTGTFGCGLDGVIRARARDLFGILNGIDTSEWDPANDPLIAAMYDANCLEGKATCKASLQREALLPVHPETPVFGLITRLAFQKGVDVFAHALERILSLDVQIVLLGSGDHAAERFFEGMTRKFPHKFRAWLGFNQALSHRIEAGSDFFLMPSRYEPCGLNQMYSCRYGTLPIVRATGGLQDTVENYDERTGTGTGFKFHDLNPSSLFDVVGWAVSTWYDRRPHILAMRQRAMRMDFSWSFPAQRYEDLYRLACKRKRGQT